MGLNRVVKNRENRELGEKHPQKQQKNRKRAIFLSFWGITLGIARDRSGSLGKVRVAPRSWGSLKSLIVTVDNGK